MLGAAKYTSRGARMKNGTFHVVQSPTGGWQVLERQGDTDIYHFFPQPAEWIADEIARRFNAASDVLAYARREENDELYQQVINDVFQLHEFTSWEQK
jgi:hypothetical protein